MKGALISFFKFRPQTNIFFISTKHNIQPILKAYTVGKCLVSFKDAAVISFDKCLMLFLRQDSSFGPSVDRIFFFFSLGEGWRGRLFEEGAYLIFLASRGGANSKGGRLFEEGR